MKRLLLLSFMLIGLLWVSCEKEEQDGVPPVKKGQIPKIQELPTLEASTAKEADFVEGKKLIVHGNITLQNNIPYFKFSDGTLIKIFSYNTQSFPQEIITKLNTEGQEVSVTGTFTNYKLKNGQTIKEIVYEGKEDLNFGKSPETEEILTLEASTSKVADYTAHLGKKVKLHGNIAEIQGNKSFFKLSDNTLIQIFTPKFKELPAEISNKLKTVGQEVTVTGVFTDYKKDESSPVVRQIIYQNTTEDLLFGNITPPTPEEIPTLETSTAKIADYTAHLGKKVKLHGNIAEIQGNKSFFKLSDNTLIQIFTPKFKELPSEISDKLKTVGQEVTVTGVFTDYKKDESSPVVRQIIYQNATEDLLFGNITPPIPEEIPTLEASTSKVADYTAHLGKKVKLHGIITIKNNLPYFKFKDGTEIQVIPQNYDALSNETKDKLATEGYELTATGTFRTQGTIKRLVYESENNLAFGNPPAPKPTLVLEANTATASHFEEGRKAKIHGLITVKGSSTYFKFKDGTEIQIYTDNFNNISQGTKDKLKQEGYELTATGTFRTKGTIKRLVYESENDLAFGNPPAPKPTLEIEASTATINQFEENREAKIHGNITVKNGNSYFKFQDGTLIQIFAYKSVKEAFSAEEKKKFTTEGQELTVTGTFVTYNGIKEIKVTKKENVIFGNTPTPTPPTQGNIFDFEDLPTGTASYTETGTLNGADGVTLKYVARTDVDKYGIQGKGLILFNKKPSNNTYIEITFPKGVKDFSFEYREAFGKGNRHFVIYEGEEGNSKKLDEKTFKNISTKETYSKTLNKSGSYTLTIKPAQGSKQFVIDNIKWTK